MKKIQLDVYLRAHGGSNSSTERIDVGNFSKVRVYFYWKHGQVVKITSVDQEILKKLYKGIGGNSGALLNNDRRVINEEIEVLNKLNNFDPQFRGQVKENRGLLKNKIVEQIVPNYCITWDDERFRTGIIMQGSDGTKNILDPRLVRERFPESLKQLILFLEDPENFLGVIAMQYHQVNLHWTSCRKDHSIDEVKKSMGRKAPGASENLNRFSDTFEKIKRFNKIIDPDINLKTHAFKKLKNHYYEAELLRARVAFLERRHSAPGCSFCISDDEGSEGWPDLHFSDSEF